MSRQDHVREFAAAALSEGRCDYFIGWKEGHNSSEVIPAFVKDPAEVEQLIWNPLCHHNLVTFLKRNMPDPPDAKIGVCVKGCDSRTLVALLQEELVDKDKLYVVGVPCDGIVDRRKLEKEFADEIVDISFPERGKVVVTTRQGRDERICPRRGACSPPAAAAAIPIPSTPTTPRGRWRRNPSAISCRPTGATSRTTRTSPTTRSRRCWSSIYSTCVRCFACINVCPVCYCWDKCVNRSRQPELVAQKVGPKENLLFQMVHMFHVAGRCPSCGACDRACPVEIPLALLHRKMNKEIFEMFAFEPGAKLDEKPVFQTFKIEDAFGD